jgi:hypothetical protein
VADGAALHIDHKSASDEILISHPGIGKAREPLQFTTSSFHFAFSRSLGHKQSFNSLDNAASRERKPHREGGAE